MPARPRKPFALHVAQGTDRKYVRDREEGGMQVPAGPVGDVPEWMGPHGREEWERLTTHPTYSKVLSPLFRSTLIEYCAILDKRINYLSGNGDALTSTEVQMLNSLRMQLGITPASAGKVKAPAAPKAESPWAKLANTTKTA